MRTYVCSRVIHGCWGRPNGHPWSCSCHLQGLVLCHQSWVQTVRLCTTFLVGGYSYSPIRSLCLLIFTCARYLDWVVPVIGVDGYLWSFQTSPSQSLSPHVLFFDQDQIFSIRWTVTFFHCSRNHNGYHWANFYRIKMSSLILLSVLVRACFSFCYYNWTSRRVPVGNWRPNSSITWVFIEFKVMSHSEVHKFVGVRSVTISVFFSVPFRLWR